MPVDCRVMTILEGCPSHLVSTTPYLALGIPQNAADDGKGVGNKRISMEFTGGLTYNSSGSLIAEYVPGQRRWSGKPSPTMDEAWEDLEECEQFLAFSLSPFNLPRTHTKMNVYRQY